MAMTVAPAKKSDLWVVENGDVQVGVQKSTGWIRSITWKGTNVDLFQAGSGWDSRLRWGHPRFR